MGILAGPIHLLKALFMVLRHPRLIRLGLIPSIFTLVLSGLGLWMTISYSDGLVQAIWPEPSDGALHWVWAAVSGLISISSSVLIVIITPWMVMIFGIPLCEPLSAEVDILLGGQHEAASFVGTLMDTIRTTLVLSVIGIGGAVGFYALGLVPGLALITTPFVSLIWTTIFATYNVYDSPMARRHSTVKQKFRGASAPVSNP